MIKAYKDLEVYNLSYELTMDIFLLTRKFPKEELYSLTSQIVRSSRSISGNIVEGCAKRIHEKKFKLHLVDALGSIAETQNWISFAMDCGYITEEQFQPFNEKIERVGKMLTNLPKNWKTFKKSSANFQPPTSNIEPQTSSIKPQASNIEFPISNFEHRD